MPLANPHANWSDYVEHLQLLATWLLPLEAWLGYFSDGPQGEQAPGFINYAEIIHKDLGDNFQAPKPVTHFWATTDDPAYRWGICYVIEGSQLGGEFLYKRLAERLSPHELIYLQRKQPGRWPAFLQGMAKEVTTQEQINKACAGARDAFDALLLLLPLREHSL